MDDFLFISYLLHMIPAYSTQSLSDKMFWFWLRIRKQSINLVSFLPQVMFVMVCLLDDLPKQEFLQNPAPYHKYNYLQLALQCEHLLGGSNPSC